MVGRAMTDIEKADKCEISKISGDTAVIVGAPVITMRNYQKR